MRPSLSILERTRTEKAAADCGFDLAAEAQGSDLRLGSTQFPETVHVRSSSAGGSSFCPATHSCRRELHRPLGAGWWPRTYRRCTRSSSELPPPLARSPTAWPCNLHRQPKPCPRLWRPNAWSSSGSGRIYSERLNVFNGRIKP